MMTPYLEHKHFHVLGDGLFWIGFRKSKGGILKLFAVALQHHEISIGASAKVVECNKRMQCTEEFIFNNLSYVTVRYF
jgi:hypothetical protein